MQPLTSPPDRSWGDDSPWFHQTDIAWPLRVPFGKYPNPGQVYVVPLSDRKAPAGKPQQVTPQETDFTGLAWTSDGRRLVFSAAQALWTVALDGKVPAPCIAWLQP